MKSFADSLASAVHKTTKEWAAIKKKEERDRSSAVRLREKYIAGRSLRTTIKEVAYAVMPEAYRKAGGGQYPVNARQLSVKGGVKLDHFGGAKVDQLVKG